MVLRENQACGTDLRKHLPREVTFVRVFIVDLAVPIIYVRNDGKARSSLLARLLALGIAAGCLSLLVTAARLQPSRTGTDTHRGLGMPACEFMRRTGIPCPSCGMTTSFAWFVRGKLAASLYVQPTGTLLAALACCTVWVGLYVAITGRPVYRLFGLTSGRYLYMPVLVFALAAWGWKILIHLSGHDGW
jgi:hypothetical protein